MGRNSARSKNTHVAKLHTAPLVLHKTKVEETMSEYHRKGIDGVPETGVPIPAHSTAQSRDSAAMVVPTDHRADVSMDLTSIRFTREQSNVPIRPNISQRCVSRRRRMSEKTFAASAPPTDGS